LWEEIEHYKSEESKETENETVSKDIKDIVVKPKDL
jgi:hypothetical protein